MVGSREAIIEGLLRLRWGISGTGQPKCYISGPMTGLPNFNKRSFEEAAQALREAGWFVYSPVENDAEVGIELDGCKGTEPFDFKKAMQRDLWQVCDSNAVIVLPGWEHSKGAKIEVFVAHEVEVPVYTFLNQRKIEQEGSVLAHEFSSRPDPENISWPPGGGNSDLELVETAKAMRQFDTGATRNDDQEQLDYEGFLSPISLRRFAEYMHEHRFQAGGTVRASDNWQKGIPRESYRKSLLRHTMDVWLDGRGFDSREDVENALCGVIFNAQGLLHEIVKTRVESEKEAA